MELFLMEAVRGIAGGMTSGATYLSTVVGSNDPPGIAAARTALGRIPVGRSPPGRNSVAPVMAPAFSIWRLVSITSPPWLSGHTNWWAYANHMRNLGITGPITCLGS